MNYEQQNVIPSYHKRIPSCYIYCVIFHVEWAMIRAAAGFTDTLLKVAAETMV